MKKSLKESDDESRDRGAAFGASLERFLRSSKEIEEKIRRDGPWASARLQPLNRSNKR